MDEADARRLLGIAGSLVLHDEWGLVVDAYRRRIRATHPDLGGDERLAAAINEAIDVLRLRRDDPIDSLAVESEPSAPASPPAPDIETVAHDVRLVGHDTLLIAAPPDEAMRRVIAGLDLIGEVTYLDASGPIAEAIVVLEDGSSHSLVVTFQGRGAETEVFATLESIERVQSSNPKQVLTTLARFIPAE